MSENNAIHIHTRLRPEQITMREATIGSSDTGAQSAPERATEPRRRVKRRQRPWTGSARSSRGDRLLRNSAIACAILLGVLTLGNLDAPWARKAGEGIERALSMHIDLDEHIGALQFVRQLMPESALVFMNLSGEESPVRPVDGPVSHVWTNLQPWVMFKCPADAEVRAVESGTVTAVSALSGGEYGVLVDHGGGRESLYAGLAKAEIASGDAVERGQALGKAGDSAYFEYRSDGESVDPAPMLGL